MKFISAKPASRLILGICTFALGMHLMILLGLLPYSFVWGGRLDSRSEVLIFEGISIVVQLFFMLIVAMKAELIFPGRWRRTVTVGIWIFIGIMGLNTVGNLASLSSLETIIMTPLTALLTYLLLCLAMEK